MTNRIVLIGLLLIGGSSQTATAGVRFVPGSIIVHADFDCPGFFRSPDDERGQAGECSHSSLVSDGLVLARVAAVQMADTREGSILTQAAIELTITGAIETDAGTDWRIDAILIERGDIAVRGDNDSDEGSGIAEFEATRFEGTHPGQWDPEPPSLPGQRARAEGRGQDLQRIQSVSTASLRGAGTGVLEPFRLQWRFGLGAASLGQKDQMQIPIPPLNFFQWGEEPGAEALAIAGLVAERGLPLFGLEREPQGGDGFWVALVATSAVDASDASVGNRALVREFPLGHCETPAPFSAHHRICQAFGSEPYPGFVP